MAFGAAWLADRPGEVMIVWQGRRIETSVAVLARPCWRRSRSWPAVDPAARSCVRLGAAATSAHRRGPARLCGALAGADRGRLGRLAAARRFTDEAPASRPASRWRCCSARNRRSSPAIGRPPSALSRRWRSAPTPRRSACTDCSSRRSAARTRRRARLMPRKRRAATRRRLGRQCGARIPLRRPAIGPARWSGSSATRALIDKAGYRASARCCWPRVRSPPRRPIATAPRLRARGRQARPTLVPAAALAGRLLGEAGELRQAARIIENAWQRQSASRSRRHLCASAPGRFRPRPARPGRRCWRATPAMSRARWRSRRPRSMRGNSPSPAPRSASTAAPTKRAAMLIAELEESGTQRRRPRPRMDGARGAGRARPGLDRRRLRVGPLAAGVADRPARCLRMARPLCRHCRRGRR